MPGSLQARKERHRCAADCQSLCHGLSVSQSLFSLRRVAERPGNMLHSNNLLIEVSFSSATTVGAGLMRA